MRHFILAPLSLLALFPLAALLAAHDPEANSRCPAPSVQQDGQCVLTDDATLGDTMWIGSGTTLNCQGHRLMPVTTGTLDDPRTTTNEFQPSQPELALFVHRSYNVTIQNCVISDFDFGIIVAQSKAANAPLGLRRPYVGILDNTIDVRTNPIGVIKSDGVTISDNRLTYASERGRGVVLEVDSDRNNVLRNTILSTDEASTGHVRQVPGGPFVTQLAVMDNEIHSLQGNLHLQNLIVSGILIQIASGEPSSAAILEDTTRPSHNLIEANTIMDLGVGESCTLDPGTSCQADTVCINAGKGVCLLKQDSGIAFNLRSADTLVRGNRVSGPMNRGISFSGTAALTKIDAFFPSSCTLNPGRLCLTDADCGIRSYDVRNFGACGHPRGVSFDGNSLRLTAEDNTVSGAYDSAALFAAETNTFIFRGNTVEGGVSGIRINAPALNGSIERNVVSGSANALYLARPSVFPPIDEHAIRLNDFTRYSVAIRTADNFTVATDIAADTGNYWGLRCPGFDPRRVLFDNGAVNPFVTDGKPYGVPVARTPDGSLPAPCQ